jgi:hypothetical protein
MDLFGGSAMRVQEAAALEKDAALLLLRTRDEFFNGGKR